MSRDCLPGCTIGGVRNVDVWQQLINRTPIKHEMSMHLSIDFEYILYGFCFFFFLVEIQLIYQGADSSVVFGFYSIFIACLTGSFNSNRNSEIELTKKNYGSVGTWNSEFVARCTPDEFSSVSSSSNEWIEMWSSRFINIFTDRKITHATSVFLLCAPFSVCPDSNVLILSFFTLSLRCEPAST